VIEAHRIAANIAQAAGAVAESLKRWLGSRMPATLGNKQERQS
jgi:hypothetical protein